jgi:hypothetical protein
MNSKTRMTIKKELKAIAQSGCKIDKVVFDYFMSNVDKAGFNDREIIYLICDILCEYNFEDEDLELSIADYLLKRTSMINHSKLSWLLYNSVIHRVTPVFELCLKNNVIILPESIYFIDFFLEDSELYNDYEVEDINEYYRKSNILKSYFRKQKIENIRNRNKMQI